MPLSNTMTIRLEPELKARLEKLATATSRTETYLAAEAIREFVELNEWQIQEIRAAVEEADAGDFASEEDVAAAFRRWEVDGS